VKLTRCIVMVLSFHAVVSTAASDDLGPAGAAEEGGLSVKSVGEVPNPCDVNKQRMKKVGGSALGAIIGYGVCRLATEIVDKDSSTSSKNKKSAACAVVGGIAGYTFAADSSRRQCELFQIAQQNQIEASFQEVTIVQSPAAQPAPAPGQTASTPAPNATEAVVAVTTLGGLSHFASGSAKLTPEAQQYFAAIARQYTLDGQQESLQKSLENKDDKKTAKPLKQDNLEALRKEWAEIKIVLIGHTDDTGTDALNATLSEQRARTVAEAFRAAGVIADKLYYQGAGSSMPIADNRTEDGRARNRRVEVVELPPGADVAGYLALRRPNPAFFRPRPETKVAAVSAKPPASPKPPATPKPPVKQQPAASDDWSVPTPTQQTAPAPTATKKPSPPPARTVATIDFGGQAAKSHNEAILAAMGPPASRGSSWGFISTAVAADDTIYGAPCTRDSEQANQGLPVKQLGTDRPVYKTNEYLPGFNNTAWMGSVNGHGVALNQVAILRAGNEPVRNPELLVYKDYDRTGNRTATLKSATKVKVYEGQQGLLYRVFVPNSYLRCVDVVVPVGGSLDAVAGSLYYERNNTVYEAAYVPSRVRTQ
jgi:outer membrane protein OmpA-like peptidoglycan-associated protein